MTSCLTAESEAGPFQLSSEGGKVYGKLPVRVYAVSPTWDDPKTDRKGTLNVSTESVGGADGPRPAGSPSSPAPLQPDDFEAILQKLKLLEFGLYGLQQTGRGATPDVEDLGPFFRLAEEIESDVLELQRRLGPPD